MASPAVIAEFAPTGKLRAAINFDNPILASRDAATGEPGGISVALARELARRLAVPIEVDRKSTRLNSSHWTL
jgi:polar amino acid transport system substrate-binding protein